jgi:hypothetical protein
MYRKLQISNIVALAVTILINYLSNTGIFNGNTMKSVSDQYQNLFTPAGYAFSIWGLIYLGLGAFVVYQSKGLFTNAPPRAVVTKIGWLFVISCVANCFWVLAWLYEDTGLSVLIMCVLLLSLSVIVLRTSIETTGQPLKQVAFERWPFAIYLGWICVALIANVAAYLTKIGWKGFGLSEETWAIVMICVAVLINVMITWTRSLRESALVGAWGLTAIGVTHFGENETIYYTAFTAAGVLVANVAIHAYTNRGNYFLGR